MITSERWKQEKLGNVIDTQKGFAFKSAWYCDDGRTIVKVSDFTQDSIDTSALTRIPDEIAEKYLRYEIKEGDVIIQTVGSWPSNPASVVGRCIHVPRSAHNALLNQNAVRLSPKSEVNNRYLYHALKAPQFSNYIVGTAQGAASQAAITLEAIRAYDLPIPSLPTQHKIASILSAYDDLIENNLRRIKTMEEIAQNLYSEWFVKLRFPGHEKVRMVDSSLGKIPEGWDVTILDSVLSALESGSRPKGGIDPSMRDVPSIGAENILGLGKYNFSKEKFVSREFFEKMKRGHINNGDVLLYKDGAKIGRKSMFRANFPHSECCINEHVFILRTNEKCGQAYLFFWLDQPDITAGIINLNANAAQPGINQKGVKGLPILLPDRIFLDLFDEFVEPLLAKLFSLAKKNQILHRTRDLLLPKLISGELDVSDLDINIVEEAA